jgi:hypothetical protein
VTAVTETLERALSIAEAAELELVEWKIGVYEERLVRA